MPSGSPFEADLRAVREGRGLSLDEIQQQTRIPVDVLRRFEEGDLVGDPTYNEVYLKAFLQSYAKAVGVPAGKVLAAYDAHRGGNYRGELGPDFGGDSPARPPTPPDPAAPDAKAPQAETPSAPEPDAQPPSTPTPSDTPARRSTAPPAVEALAAAPAASSRPQPAASPPRQRVSRPAVPTARRSFDKNWGTILGLFAAFVVILGAALWFLVFSGDEPEGEDEGQTVTLGDGQEAEIDSSTASAGAAGGGPRLQVPIRVTVTAGGDGLQWFRVTEDAGERTPYWIDQGASQTFEADSSLALWGEGNASDPALTFEEATFEMQGLRFTPPNGRVLRITRANGQRFLDSLATASPAPAPANAASVPAPSSEAYE